MADEKPSLHIDTDWKKQAQEEKKRLIEEEAKKAQVTTPASAGPAGQSGTGPSGAGQTGRPAARGRTESLPPPSFPALVQSMLSQILYYLGDLQPRNGEPQVNLDMAKYQIDTLGILEEKTKGNLSEDEKKMLDTALYETRMRYVSIASQYT
jgi:Domain of unknown function (DUF1844)